ncbi:BCCT family transporter [Marihabitans asiaticum]|uniref:Choline/carnitine/betaine transport n=1 Tax=Marihabitans asiaticum TaxID=415218 RepID=A0A560WI33_9MICO|nr:BCCT family transporter [Marihabitans asiaticum]TWD17236.1 choline/carnitine/betaine transport [Marihabitans asiaticum]
MDALARRLGLRTQPTIFFVSAGLMVAILALLLLFPTQLNSMFGTGRTWIVTNLGWYFIFGVTAWLLMLLFVAFGPYGEVTLGRRDEPPQYSFPSWFAMLFAGGIGTILMFWGVAEPMSHFATPPRAGVEPYSAEAATDAMNFALYHLSLHTWAIFCLPGLAFAYFIHRYELPVRVSSVFYPLLKERIYGPIGRGIDILAILGTLFGVAVSVGLGTSQIGAGLNALFGWENGTTLKVLIIVVLTAVAVSSIVAGLDSGIKLLSNINIGMAIALMIFVFLTGGMSLFLLREIFETLGNYITALPELALWNDALANVQKEDGWGWQGGWTVFYWAWTVSWAPFMGIFLARISKGRTVREFVLGVLFAPSLFTLVWFVVFGWSAMQIDGIGGSGGELSTAVAESVPLAMFEFFENYPATQLIQGLAVLIVAIFFATSSDSASLVVDMLCTGDGEAGPLRQRVFWGVSEGALAALLIVLAGDKGLEALQQVITVVGLPMFTLMFIAGIAFVVALRKEDLHFATEIKGIPADAIAAGKEASARGEIGYDPEADHSEEAVDTARD